jgi:hypothetical protein
MIPNEYDSWVLARIVSDQPINGDLGSVSESWRPLVERLAALPAGERDAALDLALLANPDRAAIEHGINTAVPLGPAPDSIAAPPSNEWPPLRLDEALPDVEPFPLDVLPEAAARLAIEGAASIGCPPDFLAVPMLAMAGGTIGRSVSLLLKPGYFASASTYEGIIGPPSDGKSPALKIVATGVRRISSALAMEHAQAYERWKQDNSGATKGTKPPPPPRPRRIDIDDATMEVLAPLLSDNPRGLIMIRDELSAFILGMNQYKAGKGNDKPNMLKIWNGDAITKDRVGHESNIPIHCPHPALTIVGGMTPDMLGEMVDPKGRADGFIDRFLLAYPDSMPVPDWSDRGIPEDVLDGWSSLIARIWTRPLDVSANGNSVPHVMRFSPEGESRWIECCNAHSREMNAPDFPPHLCGAWGKLREYPGRLTLILALMRHAADAKANPAIVPTAGPRAVDDAWRLAVYFKSHARRVHHAIARGPVKRPAIAAKVMLDWIRKRQRPTFSIHEFTQDRRSVGETDLADAVRHLIARHAIRAAAAPPKSPNGGRPKSSSYDVHPALLVSQNP